MKNLFALCTTLVLVGCATHRPPAEDPLQVRRSYSVYGEVHKRGRQEMRSGDVDLAEAIAAAQGFTEFADQKRIRITRADGKTETVNLQRILAGENNEVRIHPGDTILVWKKGFVW